MAYTNGKKTKLRATQDPRGGAPKRRPKPKPKNNSTKK